MRIETRQLADLTPHPRNPRRHPPEQVEQLRLSLRTHGAQKPIVITEEGQILAGHGLVEAMLAEGWTKAETHIYDGPSAEGYLIQDNHSAEMGTNDNAALADLLRDLEAQGELSAAGYDVADLQELIDAVEAEARRNNPVEEGPLPEVQEGPTRVQVGEVWKLGRHRLLAADCTDAGGVAEMFGQDRLRMVWTDPPYGVNYGEKEQQLREAGYGMGDHRPIANDALSEVDTEALVRDSLSIASALSLPGAAVYVACPAGTLLPHFIAAVAASGFEYRHSLAWVKSHFVFGRCDYHYKHETILYGWKPDGAHYFVEDHTKTSVFEYAKPHNSDLHPTMKPVELVQEMVENSSRAGEVVYDPFGGSGSTLIACEAAGRVCFTCEVDPRYCDVILARWEQLTGQTAVRDG